MGLAVTTNGRLDVSDAFQRAIGPYDEMMAKYAYALFPAGQEKAGLEGVIREMRATGLHYVPETEPPWSWYDDRATWGSHRRATRRPPLDDLSAPSLGH